MSWLSTTFTSSVGKKVLMALTGLFLCNFLVVHLVGNLQLLSPECGDMEGYAFNKYTAFMTSFPLIKATSYFLYAALLFHAFQGLFMEKANRAARPVKYVVNRAEENSPWYSRSMALLGTIMLVFLVIHMWMFWAKMKFGGIEPVIYTVDGTQEELKDMYGLVKTSFSNLWYVILYVVSMVAVGYHLLHGFKSAFQSLGLNHVKYNGFINLVGTSLSVIVPFLFALIPVVMYVKQLG